MINFKNKRVAVLGWGINGLDAFQYLLKQGANIAIFDGKGEKELDFSGFDVKEARLVLGKKYLKDGLNSFDYIFRAPGVYRYLPEIVEAENKGVTVTSVVKLFFDLCPGKIIGVTGTKGKGTTSTLIYEIVKKDGKDVYLAGNIGTPMLNLLPKLKAESWVILELSSFQLIDMTKSPHIAIVLNITKDHMDWHKNREEYVEAKTQIVRHQSDKDFSILAYDYNDSRNFSKITKAEKYYFSNTQKVKGSYVKDGKIILHVRGQMLDVGNTKDLLLRGKHNWENVCGACCSSFLAGAGIDSIKETIFSFKGLEHRLELVNKVKGVTFYNDSFSTNPQTTIAAIHSFEEPLTIILGGSDKGLNYDEMGREISKSHNIKNVVLIGDISGMIEKAIEKANYKGKILKLGKSDIKKIVKRCLEITPKGGVALLSPATASFDMFKDYKDRGNQFKEAVRLLKK
ncbi:UDP-N-acetylmuramoylalanine--D-glutamate ligase [Candidatus Woesebacteria bacterium RIFCSPHIGHO2_01_FULL_39_32]|uniref:UDP-N-acetylmuramoylalanine--D-glutamate ligase n=1 Tax=Candidatus Woesebacteria bacterium RIFCSPLOWO2_01_FULL_39_25 TaxID=1802521 RepID=A0A1F8BLR1_9BACT|nr:MAG: UDP-N-acetylmuramoylalanine--D-glutamate ligase [Candidatus Woesebacteria bacterium GWB1_37_5]OGM25431.1 MAG: UDP-N-acetylmuramoylalanine--D-glutamate ligase [Candidatus Woesebacteria bacterium RIFCSPHIGHO2_01_FULL_39_32]OGM38536.1 MAG: UDP-N-acetylmuramoylalanine--D-glutamate ligase [Candidatus Woesebacteria bacterium RIFCSPHIGHO2_12_FULL_38_11]OGM64962.1 MAG: UDP-N-acetylmuramoylalanine--D-glutamate ligase [Candidatus Woesebacteria bacterium RIFCSPLOWO2_01_FULL_39_25]